MKNFLSRLLDLIRSKPPLPRNRRGHHPPLPRRVAPPRKPSFEGPWPPRPDIPMPPPPPPLPKPAFMKNPVITRTRGGKVKGWKPETPKSRPTVDPPPPPPTP